MPPWSLQRHDLAFAPASPPPRGTLISPAVFGGFAFLRLVGIEWPSLGGLALTLPLLTWLVVQGVAAVAFPARSLTIRERNGRRALLVRSGPLRVTTFSLDELAIVSRERPGEHPIVSLTDRRGSAVAIPLATWTDEDRLLEELATSAKRAGATGWVGEPVAFRAQPWVLPAYLTWLALGFVSFGFLVFDDRTEHRGADAVSPESIRETEGETVAPFADLRACDVYIVPMDRPSGGTAANAARRLAERIPAQVCSTRSYALHWTVVDERRGQIDADILVRRLADSFRSVWHDRPSAIIGVTSLDLFSPPRPDWRFAFGYALIYGRTQAQSVISTARMGSGRRLARRLDTMVMRYVGLFYFGLSENPDTASALYPTILSLQDLDRMRPQFSDPPITPEELRAARARFLTAPL